MADQLYLSLWFPNFRFAELPEKLVSVLRQFSLVSGDKRVAAASAYPLGFTESPTYQRLYVNDERSEETADSLIENAVAEATEQIYDDMAYEFEMKWQLWSPGLEDTAEGLDTVWKQVPSTVRVLGFGPEFDDGAYEQNGHIRIDFGIDTPFLHEEVDLDRQAASRVQENVQMLVDFTNAVQEHCGISSRLLWSESGESLAQKLVERLQRVN